MLNDNEPLTSNVTSDIIIVSSTQSSTSIDIIPPVINKIRKKYSPHWTTWSNWSECTRPCGSGVMFQQRRCVTR